MRFAHQMHLMVHISTTVVIDAVPLSPLGLNLHLFCVKREGLPSLIPLLECASRIARACIACSISSRGLSFCEIGSFASELFAIGRSMPAGVENFSNRRSAETADEIFTRR